MCSPIFLGGGGVKHPSPYETLALTIGKLSACANTGADAGDGDGDGDGDGASDGAGDGAGDGDGASDGPGAGDGANGGPGDGDGAGDGEPSSVRPTVDQTIPVDSEGSTIGEEEGERMDVEATQVCVCVCVCDGLGM